MNETKIITEEEKMLADFNSKFKPFQGFLIKELEKDAVYANDDERHLKEAEMALKYGAEFRKIAEENLDITSAIVSGDFETAASKIIEKMHLKTAA